MPVCSFFLSFIFASVRGFVPRLTREREEPDKKENERKREERERPPALADTGKQREGRKKGEGREGGE